MYITLIVLLVCNGIVDLGVIADFSKSIGDGHTEEAHFTDMKNFIKDTALLFDISQTMSHFAYIPFSTEAGDNENQWFNNSIVAEITSGDKIAQKAYLDLVVKKEPEGDLMPGIHV